MAHVHGDDANANSSTVATSIRLFRGDESHQVILAGAFGPILDNGMTISLGFVAFA